MLATLIPKQTFFTVCQKPRNSTVSSHENVNRGHTASIIKTNVQNASSVFVEVI